MKAGPDITARFAREPQIPRRINRGTINLEITGLIESTGHHCYAVYSVKNAWGNYIRRSKGREFLSSSHDH